MFHSRPEVPKHECIHRLFERQVQRTPAAIAISIDGSQLTYQQLNRQSNRLAYQLAALGVGPGYLVGICVDQSIDMVIGLLGILKAGGACVPISPNRLKDPIKDLVRESHIKILLTQTHLEHRLASCLPCKDINLICLDRDQWTNMQSCPDLKALVTADSSMYALYASDTTGQIRKTTTSHTAICNRLFWLQTTLPLSNQDRVLQNISFAHIPSVWQIFWPLLSGAQLILPQAKNCQNVQYIAERIRAKRVSVVNLAPSLLRDVITHPQLEQCKTLQRIFSSSEPLPLELQQPFS
ncbi:MAG: AMP-binding protein [Leptolyngbyaceae cyanobacterium]